MTFVVANEETGGLVRYPAKEQPWTEAQAAVQAERANAAAKELGIQTRYQVSDVKEWRK